MTCRPIVSQHQCETMGLFLFVKELQFLAYLQNMVYHVTNSVGGDGYEANR